VGRKTAAALTADEDLAAADAPAAAAAPAQRPLVPGVGVLAALALAWLAAMLWSTQGAVGRVADGDDIALVSAALALPGVISAALVGGAAVGLAGVALLAARRGPAGSGSWPVRLAAGAGAGLLTGVAVAIPVALGYDRLPSIVVLAVAVGAAAAIGGALAAVRPVQVVAAGVAGAIGVFAVTLLLNIFSPNLLHLYGAGETGESRFTANAWLALTVSLLSGLVSGILAYAYLRRQVALRWPGYLVAGALPGLLTMLAELVTRLGGVHLFRVASAVSADDDAYLHYLNTARINRAMVILFIGALTALVLFGRTLRPAELDEPGEADGHSEAHAYSEADGHSEPDGPGEPDVDAGPDGPAVQAEPGEPDVAAGPDGSGEARPDETDTPPGPDGRVRDQAGGSSS
jgi:hypothetical protein